MATLREQPSTLQTLAYWPRYANNLQPSKPSTPNESTLNCSRC
ncbi:hypothetical protein [Moorena sp. SIO4G3]|nr:hypothetical protein [Moorena sp. SIO4G3]